MWLWERSLLTSAVPPREAGHAPRVCSRVPAQCHQPYGLLCMVRVPSQPPRADTCVCPQPRALLGDRVGFKGSLFPRVIIPEQRNRNVLKTPRWTLLAAAGAFGCTVAPLFPSMRLEQPDHLLHPPLPQK